MRYQTRKSVLWPLVIILLPSIGLSGCLSLSAGNDRPPAESTPPSAADRPGQRPFQDEMAAPAYLEASFSYAEADFADGACRHPGAHTSRYFWCGLLTASMAGLKQDYITRLCLYSVGSEAHYKRGFLMDILGYHDLAILEYTQAIELNPGNARYYNNRGSLFLMQGRSLPAVADFTHAIEINPNRAEAYYNRGRALERMGKYDAARRDYQQAIRLGICDTYPSLKICR